MLIWLSGVVDLAARCGGILYLDEANFMGERVTSSLHPLADHRHHFINRNKPVYKDGQFMPETVTGHLDLWIIATINEGYRGTGNFNEAFAGRFENVLWGYNDEVERILVKSPRCASSPRLCVRLGRPRPSPRRSAPLTWSASSWASRPSARRRRSRICSACSSRTSGPRSGRSTSTARSSGCWRTRFSRRLPTTLPMRPRPSPSNTVTSLVVQCCHNLHHQAYWYHNVHPPPTERHRCTHKPRRPTGRTLRSRSRP